MRLAVASGKGGTGKTTITSSLINIWPRKLVAVDMDVEEPNLHLFLNPTILDKYVSKLRVPIIDEQKCNYCKICSNFCQFSAISLAGQTIMTFSEMCHGCGGCMVLCPENAIDNGDRVIGEIIHGSIKNNLFVMGKLRVGEAMSPPLMRDIHNQLETFNNKLDFIIDCPPGTSCPAINSVLKSDLILLVTESTPFGLYDLKLAYDSFFHLDIPMAVVLNRFNLGEDKISEFCKSKNLPIISRIPYSREIATFYSNGEIVSDSSNELREIFVNIVKEIQLLLKNRVYNG